ncbi:hypothetical protein RFI_33772, partial [Reticulomyxa filosa]
NLQQDDFLKGLMDAEGWVKARYLEQFPRLKSMGATAIDIVAAITNSDIVETSEMKIRRKNDWNKYLPNQEACSNRFLEGMALRIEDQHAKRQYFKQKQAAKSAAKDQNSSKKDDKTSTQQQQPEASTAEENNNVSTAQDDDDQQMELID